ncbi:hypothetical protein PR001_g3122 [Phytophthora rubi]|uniref:Dicer-like protein 1 n=1 Tax=Phytophthora rubi TaxID=129364 RepID=A0A6A3PB18_9STRA|nr:hypothetical protein PR001_g3122 [Phytophthora rubi]
MTQPVELRAFQREILELAREKNVVMVGDTGIGKTFLAIALLSEQDYSGDKRAFFMAPTRQLVVQITAKIRQTSTLSVNAYCGRTADLWDAAQWERELQLTRVFVCTPEIVRNVLLKGYVTLSRMNLLVFDECHHVTKRHPYAQVIKMFNHEDEEDAAAMPRIFGTTACPTRHCAEKLHAELRKVDLDQSQIAQFAAAAPMIYETYPVQQPWGDGDEDAANSSWVFENMEKELEQAKAVAVFEKLVRKGKSDAANDPAKLEKARKKFVQNCITIYKNLGPWCYYRFAELEINRLAIAASLLITVPGSMFGLDQDAVRTMLILAGKRVACNFACTAKVQKVEEILKAQLFNEEGATVEEVPGAELSNSDVSDSENEAADEGTSTLDEEQLGRGNGARLDLQGIVFVNTRTECRVLSDYFNEKFAPVEETAAEEEPDNEEFAVDLDEAPVDQPFASILGRASRSDTASFQLPKMETTLKKFETGSIRVLISTAVSVEGVDFPQCGLIVVMDRVGTSRMLMQLKGRARHEDGIVYYLAEEGDLAHDVYYKQLVRETEVINQLEFSREKVETIQQQPRSIAAQMMGKGVQKIEIESTGAVLDLDSSIACINQFCQSLPSRLFTVDVKRMYSISDERCGGKSMFTAELNLPMELELEPFRSDPMPSKAGARASAAFSACQKLLEQQLLDDSLNSIYRTTKVKSSSSVRDLSYFLDRLHT